LSQVGKVIGHPLFTAIIGGITGSVFTWITLKNVPPIVSLVPNSIAVKAADIVTFDGQGSVDSDGEIIEFEWRVGGFNLDKTGIASCDEIGNQTQITCRFAIPGSHIVSLAAIDNDGAKSVQASNVVVSMQGGYIGVVLQYGEKIKDTNLQNAFNYGVDWVSVQTLLRGKPIVLYDPIKQSPVFATQFTRSISKAKEFAKKSDNAKGLKVLAHLPPDAKEKLTVDLFEIGVAVTFVDIGFGEVFPALEAGLANSSLTPLNDPQELSNYYE
jgi:hypothetical protein